MRSTLRTLTMAGLFAVGGTLGLGGVSARACEHGPLGPAGAPPWAYGAGFGGPGMPGFCSICFSTPPAFAPPWQGGVHVVRVTRRYVPAGYRRVMSYSAYATPQGFEAGPAYGMPQEIRASYPSAQGATVGRSLDYAASPNLVYPMKSAPAPYAAPQAPGYPPEAYATPQEIRTGNAGTPALLPARSPYPAPGLTPEYPGKFTPYPAKSAPSTYAAPQAPAGDLGSYRDQSASIAPLGPDSVPPPPVTLRPGEPGWPQG